MWRTPEGNRILKGAEGRLMRASLDSLVERLEDDICFAESLDHDQELVLEEFGVPLFDELDHGQKLVLLADVSKALFKRSVPWPRHTAVAEAAVYVLYWNIISEIKYEIQCQVKRSRKCRKCRKWRRMVLAACRQWGFDEAFADFDDDEDDYLSLPEVDCPNLAAWRVEVFDLADLVLWDRDWELADVFMDSAPEAATMVRRHLGIDEDYFVAVPPLATKRTLTTARRTIEELVRRKPR